MKRLLSRLKKAILGATGPDGFPMDQSSPYFAIHSRVNEFFSEIPDLNESFDDQPARFASARKILDAPAEEQILAVEAILLRRAWIARHDSTWYYRGPFDLLRKLTSLLLRRNLPYTPAQAAQLVSIIAKGSGQRFYDDDLGAVLKVCEKLKADGAVSAELRSALENLKESLNPKSRWEDAKRRRIRETVDRLIARRPQSPFDSRDEWTATVSKDLVALNEKQQTAWQELIVHTGTATQSKAPAKWLKEADRLLNTLGIDEFKLRMTEWLRLIRPSGKPNRPHANPEIPIRDRNADILKGLVWCCSRVEDEKLTAAVSDLAQICFKKIPGWGPLSNKVGNACLFALSQLPGLAPIGQLSRLRLKVKYSVPLRLIDDALQDAATKLGMTSDELEEIAVPTYGLDEHGSLREEFGDFTAEVRITGTDSTELFWIKTDGKTQKSIPTEVKEELAPDLKELKRNIQEIEKMLPAQRVRIERLLLLEREWEFEKWRERYSDHPLLANLARRLIWHFRSGSREGLAIWHEGKLVDIEDRSLDWLKAETRVRLWHPLGTGPQIVLSWRRWLESHQVAQPFKQAHREIYVLTDAERQTDTYSNRFAAHIIRQHQFAALAKQRGWKYTLQGAFDSHNTPTLALPRWNLEAQFWVNPPGGNEDTSDTGIYLHLATDQVRFCAAGGRPRPLSEIPALLFSEVMRDVDLFVGVCSIGNDPLWRDSGEGDPYPGAYGAYWHDFSFGDLSSTARTRHDVLQRLLPRLKIAKQCSLEDKFLRVRGKLGTYKIHLGSGNILMEPNDRYLCIVADRGGASARGNESILLPFEGDATLDLILSKAFLLADEDQIKDRQILSQIARP